MRSGNSVAVLAIFGLLMALPVGAQDSLLSASVVRIGSSEDPVMAAVAISRHTFPEAQSATGVVVARDDEFADALTGATVAASRGPVLFTTGGPDEALRTEVAEEVVRVLDDSGCVYILGGSGAVSAHAEADLSSLTECVERLAGPTRVETSIAAADLVVAGQRPDRVLLARSDDWADAITGGAAAAQSGAPLLVTGRDSLHPAVAEWLTRHQPREIILLGGTAALADTVAGAASQVAPTGRVAGRARDETAAAVARQLWEGGTGGAVLLNGYASTAWTYALAAAPTAARSGTPQLYASDTGIPPGTSDALLRLRPEALTLVGPSTFINNATATAAAGYLDQRVTGTTLLDDVATVTVPGSGSTEAHAEATTVAPPAPSGQVLTAVADPVRVSLSGVDGLAEIGLRVPPDADPQTTALAVFSDSLDAWVPVATEVSDGMAYTKVRSTTQPQYAGLDDFIEFIGGTATEFVDGVVGVFTFSGDAAVEFAEGVGDLLTGDVLDVLFYTPSDHGVTCDPRPTGYEIIVEFDGAGSFPANVCLEDRGPGGVVMRWGSQRFNALGVSGPPGVRWAGQGSATVAELLWAGLYGALRFGGVPTEYVLPGESDLSLRIDNVEAPLTFTATPTYEALLVETAILSLSAYIAGAVPTNAADLRALNKTLTTVSGVADAAECMVSSYDALWSQGEAVFMDCAQFLTIPGSSEAESARALQTFTSSLGLVNKVREAFDSLTNPDDHRVAYTVNRVATSGPDSPGAGTGSDDALLTSWTYAGTNFPHGRALWSDSGRYLLHAQNDEACGDNAHLQLFDLHAMDHVPLPMPFMTCQNQRVIGLFSGERILASPNPEWLVRQDPPRSSEDLGILDVSVGRFTPLELPDFLVEEDCVPISLFAQERAILFDCYRTGTLVSIGADDGSELAERSSYAGDLLVSEDGDIIWYTHGGNIQRLNPATLSVVAEVQAQARVQDQLAAGVLHANQLGPEGERTWVSMAVSDGTPLYHHGLIQTISRDGSRAIRYLPEDGECWMAESSEGLEWTDVIELTTDAGHGGCFYSFSARYSSEGYIWRMALSPNGDSYLVERPMPDGDTGLYLVGVSDN